VLIQGNTDERGTDEEYTLALGQHRSDTVLH
jgi:outer membrane protein OmpA-like peptidoglycan-associated protein